MSSMRANGFPEMYPIFELLSDADRGIVFKALYLYAVDGIDAELTGACAFAWPLLKMKVDEARQRYLQKCEQNRANIRKRYDRIPSNTAVYDRIPSNTKDYELLPNLPTKTKAETETNNIIVPTPDGAGNADKKKGKVFTPESNAYKLDSLLADRIAERMPTTERADERQIQSWALDFDRCRRLDKHPWAEIEDVLEWSQEDTFWQGNILSGGKFRKQYMTLLAQMNRRAAT